MKSFALTIVLSLLLFSNHSLFTSEQASYVCNLSRADGTICNKSFLRHSSLTKHQNQIHSTTTFRCPQDTCSHESNSYGSIKSHACKIHKIQLPLMNDLSDELYEIIAGHPRIKKWYCPICIYIEPFSTYNALSVHSRCTGLLNHSILPPIERLKDTNPDLYKIITKGPSNKTDEGKSEIELSSSSSEHLEQGLSNQRMNCPLCSNHFEAYPQLKSHMAQSHRTPLPPQSKLNASLYKEIFLHEKIIKFCCPESNCTRKFTRLYFLKKHHSKHHPSSGQTIPNQETINNFLRDDAPLSADIFTTCTLITAASPDDSDTDSDMQ